MTTTNPTSTSRSMSPTAGSAPSASQLPVWRLNVLRVGYLVMGVGLAVKRWPLLADHQTWGLKEGTVICMLVAMSVLALLGLRHPQRMLPILLFEVGWKLIWLGLVALPMWRRGDLDAATREQVAAVAWVVVIIAVVPWRHVVRQYLMAPGEPWRSSISGEARAVRRHYVR